MGVKPKLVYGKTGSDKTTGYGRSGGSTAPGGSKMSGIKSKVGGKSGQTKAYGAR